VVLVTVVFMGEEIAAWPARVPVVKMWPSRPQISDADVGDEDGGLFFDTYF